MEQSDSAADHQDKGEPNEEHADNVAPVTWFGVIGWVVLIGGGVLVYVAHYYVGEHSARVKFFTEALLSFMVLIVIVIQATIYYQQSKTMERSANLARHALYFSERPYVVVYDVQVTNLPFEIGKVITYEVTVENKGKTPAYDVEFRMYIDVEPQLLPQEPNYRRVRTEDSSSRVTLGMNIPAKGKQHATAVVLTEREVVGIKDGNVFAYIWGIVRYRDGLTSKPHHTKFYLVYDPEEGRFTRRGHHNDMT